jgi:hypothetical protein
VLSDQDGHFLVLEIGEDFCVISIGRRWIATKIDEPLSWENAMISLGGSLALISFAARREPCPTNCALRCRRSNLSQFHISTKSIRQLHLARAAAFGFEKTRITNHNHHGLGARGRDIESI